MNRPSKKRLCWNCEGSVSVEAETCPYCGVSVVPASLEAVNISAGFAPSYQSNGKDQENSLLRSPYSDNKDEPQTEVEEQKNREAEENIPAYDEFQRALIASILLLTGSVLFLFGLALMLFSQDGLFVLKWDATFWFMYLGIGLPLLAIGWKYFSQLEKTQD